MAGALANRLARRAPAPEIHMVAPPWALPVVARLPQVAKGWALDIGHGRLGVPERWRLARSIKAERFDEAIVLPRSFKSALVPFFAGIPRRRGALGEMRFGLINDVVSVRSKARRTVDDFVAMADGRLEPMRADEAPRLVADEAAGAALAERFGIQLDRPLVALCPGAEYGPAKRWPAQHFAELARRLVDNDMSVAIFGSAKDRPAAEIIVADDISGRIHDLSGRTALVEAIDLMALSAVVVTNDSGLMHVAAALSRPIVALFGSSSPERTPPLSEKASVLSIELACRPCFERTCPLGHTDCLVKIDVERVLAAVSRHLPARSEAG